MSLRTTIILLLLLLLTAPDTHARTEDGVSAFLAARTLATDEDYAGAIKLYEEALPNLREVEDHVLYVLADSYFRSNQYDQALQQIETIGHSHSHSPLMRRVRALEIQVLLASGGFAEARKAMYSYLKAWPDDSDVRYQYAVGLQAQGSDRKADQQFQEIYVRTGPLASAAYDRMKSKRLTPALLKRRAENLMEAHAYAEAEVALKELKKYRGFQRKWLNTSLASALFRQKKYTEAAPLLYAIDDRYNAALAQIRSGQLTSFSKTIYVMLKRHDADVVELLAARAEEARRADDPETAEAYLDTAIKAFPDKSELAWWYKGWLLYSQKEFVHAAEVFHDASARFPDHQEFPYWEARSRERAGQDALALYQNIKPEGYYGYLASQTLGREVFSDYARTESTEKEANADMDFSRQDLLIALGLKNEAAEELMDMTRKTSKTSRLIPLAQKLIETERYRDAIAVMIRIPEGERPASVMYPLAYWDTVDAAASYHGLDPLLLLSLIRQESLFDDHAVSSAGALGLMQLMPKTASKYAVPLGITINGRDDILDVSNNILIGIHYFNQLADEFEMIAPVLASYNAGEARVRQWLKRGYASEDEFVEDIPYKETRNYVKRILSIYQQYRTHHEQRASAQSASVTKDSTGSVTGP